MDRGEAVDSARCLAGHDVGGVGKLGAMVLL
jgi:hypothetical protein